MDSFRKEIYRNVTKTATLQGPAVAKTMQEASDIATPKDIVEASIQRDLQNRMKNSMELQALHEADECEAELANVQTSRKRKSQVLETAATSLVRVKVLANISQVQIKIRATKDTSDSTARDMRQKGDVHLTGANGEAIQQYLTNLDKVKIEAYRKLDGLNERLISLQSQVNECTDIQVIHDLQKTVTEARAIWL